MNEAVSPANSFTEADIDELHLLLEAVPTPLEAMTLSMLDGYLCGVLVQPQWHSVTQWLPYVIDSDGRAPPAHFQTQRLHTLVMKRYNQLKDFIDRRQWFDPLIFDNAVDEEADDEMSTGSPGDHPLMSVVEPWVHGFAAAQELFPTLINRKDPAVTEPLALIFRHLQPDDLEDADELLAEIDTLEPPADLSEAVEALVRATLLLADLKPPASRPQQRPPRRQ